MIRWLLVSLLVGASFASTGCCGGRGASALYAVLPEEPAGPVVAPAPTAQKLARHEVSAAKAERPATGR